MAGEGWGAKKKRGNLLCTIIVGIFFSKLSEKTTWVFIGGYNLDVCSEWGSVKILCDTGIKVYHSSNAVPFYLGTQIILLKRNRKI